MKKLTTLLVALLISFSSFAQNGINYKALIKDGAGNVVASSLVTVQFQILQGTGLTNVYQETQTPTTDANGIIIINIGEGTPVSGVFADINWGSDDHFLNVQINTGSGLVDMGTTQFKAVPYALNAANVSGLETIDEGNGNGWRMIGSDPLNYGNIGLNATDVSYSNIASDTDGATGSFSTAMGYKTTASGDGSTVMGYNTTASAFLTTALGYYNIGGGDPINTVDTDPLFEIGNGTYSNPSNALTVLKNGTITAPSLTNTLIDTAGDKALITKEYLDLNASTGLETIDEGNGNGWRYIGTNPAYYGPIGSLASDFSFNNSASDTRGATGISSTAFGYKTSATGLESFASGESTNANSYLSFVTGLNNIGGGHAINWIDTDPLFEIGNGTTTPSNALTVLKNGTITAPSFTNTLINTAGDKALITKEYLDLNSSTGLEAIDEGNGIGWRLIGSNPLKYGNIGSLAVDLSINDGTDSDTYGATGIYSTATGRKATASGDYSTAMGIITNASGYSSLAMGHGGQATGHVSVAIGNGPTASGGSSIAMGEGTTASGNHSTAMGGYTTALGNYSTAMGFRTTTSAYGSVTTGFNNIGGGNPDTWVYTDPLFEIGNGGNTITPSNALTVLKNGTITAPSLTNTLIDTAGDKALITKEYLDLNSPSGLEAIDEGNGIGWRLIGSDLLNYGNIGLGATDLSFNNTLANTNGATGEYSLASGLNTVASGRYSTAMGRSTIASGDFSTAMGFVTTASGDNSTAMGYNTTASTFGSTALGYNSVGGGDPNTPSDSDPLFEIGNGLFLTPSNALTILKNGNTSIGANFPGSYRLYVTSAGTGTTASTGKFENSDASGISMIIDNSNAASSDNALIVTTKGTGNIVSFDSWQGTGSWNRRFIFTNDGDGRCDGSWIAGGADYAEYFPKALLNKQYEPGDVIAMSTSKGYSVEAANTSQPNLIVGVYSSNPAIVGNSSAEEDPENNVLVGLMGVISTKINNENGSIKIGDFLTISSTQGIAMKATKSGYVIGRAMENYSSNSQGMIKVLVEPEWMNFDKQIEVLENTINALQAELIESKENQELMNIRLKAIENQFKTNK